MADLGPGECRTFKYVEGEMIEQDFVDCFYEAKEHYKKKIETDYNRKYFDHSSKDTIETSTTYREALNKLNERYNGGRGWIPTGAMVGALEELYRLLYTTAATKDDWEEKFKELCKAWKEAGILTDEDEEEADRLWPDLKLSDRDADTECLHEYVEYRGFTESYDYCSKCNIKKEYK